MKIAIEGCAHGELDKLYESVEALQTKAGIKIDLVICCGDFQAVRNYQDLRCMAIPQKYQFMCSFHKYYSGEKRAPFLTIFIGGNHEASNYLQELPYGGWVAPNIYYLGRAGVVKFGNLRIGGLSGIFKGQDYLQGLWECPPYNPNTLRSVYHIRSLDVYRLSQLKEKIHIMMSHDWPRGITDYGLTEDLLRRKPFLREDIDCNRLGSGPSSKLLQVLKPEYWFAAHLHCKFVAIVRHDEENETKFLALDKCLPRRRHLQIIELPDELAGDKLLKFDEEWLAVLKSTNHLLSVRNVDEHMPGPGGDERYEFTPTAEEKARIGEILQDLTINEDWFVRTAPLYDPKVPKRGPTNPIANPQTVKLCEMIGLDDPVQVVMAQSGREMTQPETNIKSYQDMMNLPFEKENMPSHSRTPMTCTQLSLTESVTSEETSEDESMQSTGEAPATGTELSLIAPGTPAESAEDENMQASGTQTTCIELSLPAPGLIDDSVEDESMQASGIPTSCIELTFSAPVAIEESGEDENMQTSGIPTSCIELSFSAPVTIDELSEDENLQTSGTLAICTELSPPAPVALDELAENEGMQASGTPATCTELTLPVPVAPDEPAEDDTMQTSETPATCTALSLPAPVAPVRAPEDENLQALGTPATGTESSLPATVTPNDDSCDTTTEAVSPSTSFLSEKTSSATDCATPGSSASTGKKTFKRRNVSTNNNPEDDGVSTTDNSADFASPGSSGGKKTFKRRNMSMFNTPTDDDENVSTTSSS